MRGWQALCVVTVIVSAASVGHGRTLAAQILQYNEPQHSRSESGIPGNNVTGGWSWVDHHGQQHHIWYVADTRGFRAFGDVVPRASPSTMNVGVPVVVAIPLSSIMDNSAKLTGTSQPDDTSGSKKTPPLQSPESEHDKTRQTEPTDKNVEQQESLLPPTVTIVTTDVKLDQEINAREDEIVVTELPKEMTEIDETIDDIITTSTTTPVTAPTSTSEVTSEVSVVSSSDSSTSEPAKDFVATKPLLEDNVPGSPKSLKSSQPDSADVTPLDHLSGDSFLSSKRNQVTPSDNNFVATVFDKLSTVLGAPKDNMKKPLLHQEAQKPFTGVDTITPDQDSTSDFVLINRMQAPTVSKPRVGTQRLVPQPVNVMGQGDPVVTGLHSSGKPSTLRPLTRVTGSLAPLGIHLLNLVPLPQKTVSSDRPVPRPVRVVGEPNLENFLRPAVLARTTSKPFRQPRPSRDYDYNYDYYDYTDYRGDNTGGPVNPSQKSKTKTVRSNSEEYSLETDYSDSEESENTSESR